MRKVEDSGRWERDVGEGPSGPCPTMQTSGPAWKWETARHTEGAPGIPKRKGTSFA